jgi:putative flavoprotein involved in K+ transport
MMPRQENYETIVIGGGQAGLAVGYFLRRQGRQFVILDGAHRTGDAWRGRWESLRLYSPASHDGLPGMPFPAARTRYPTAGEMADYLEAYAQRHELPVRHGTSVRALRRDGDRYLVEAGDDVITAASVVIANGVFRKPHVPAFAAGLDPSITQLHSNDYRNPGQLQDGAVLVVGASHSGSDIAFEAAGAGHEVVLCGPDTGQLPASVESRRGRMLFRGLFLVGSRVLTVDTPIGRRIRPQIRRGGGPLLRYRRKELSAAGVERIIARVCEVEAGMPRLDDGRAMDVRNVVWCTGFRPDYAWIHLPLELGEDGYPVQYRGAIAGCPGLYVVGLPFQHSFTSMLIRGMGQDAERVAGSIAAEPAPRHAPAEVRASAAKAGRIAM